MTLHQHNRQPDIDEATSVLSRRAILRRSAFGVVGVGLTTLLAACGDEDDEEIDEPAEDPIVDEPVGDQTIEDGDDAMDSEPLDPDDPAIDEETDVVPEEVEEEASE